MADAGRRRRWVGVRARTTAIAVAVVAIVLTGVAIVVVVAIDATLTDQVRDAALLRASIVAAEPSGTPTIPGGAEEEFVQVVRDGDVVSSTANVAGRQAVAAIPPGADAVVDGGVPDEGPFLVVAVEGADATILVGRSLDDTREVTSTATIALALAVPLVVAIVGVLTWMLVGRALAPIDAMRGEADRISASELDRRLPEGGAGDEVGRLAVTLNRMLGRLDSAQRRQRRFASDASHELRSPIAAIRQHAEVTRGDPAARELADEILPEVARLQTLVDDLLVLARLDEGASEPLAEVDLDDVVLAEAIRLRDRGGIAVDTTGIGAARVLGNASQLVRVFQNLTDNAGWHAGSRVAFAVSRVDDLVTASVDDDGPGIPESERERVLERFVRLDEGRGRRQGGAGLGLAIASEVVRAHGGRLDLGTSALGGLRAVVTLPAAG